MIHELLLEEVMKMFNAMIKSQIPNKLQYSNYSNDLSASI